jgi:hypothetical protein
MNVLDYIFIVGIAVGIVALAVIFITQLPRQRHVA